MAKETRQNATEPTRPAIEPEEGELPDEELDAITGGTGKGNGALVTTLSNLANMRHEMLKAVANNLRS